MELINTQPRSILSEGRSRGLGHAFCRLEKGKLITVMPISPCKDYLNDVVFSEGTGKPWSAWGLKTKKEGIFEDGWGYMVSSVCKEGARSEREYSDYADEVKALNTNLDGIRKVIAWMEEGLGLKDRSTFVSLGDNMVMTKIPKFWLDGTYRISLYTLIMRNAMEYESGDVLTYLENIRGEDTGYMGTALPKLKMMMAGNIPVQDMADCSPHNLGIVSFNFPTK